MVGLRTMDTFCSVILLNLSRSMTCIMWAKTQLRRARLQSGSSETSFFIPSALPRGVGSSDTRSNLGMSSLVNTGSGSSLRNCFSTEATTAGS